MGHVNWAIIIASGKDEQLTTESDIGFLSLGSRPVIVYSLLNLEKCPDIDGVVVVARKERMETVVGIVKMFGCTKVKKVVAGATNRRNSVLNGLKALDEDVSIVTIHDASRPCATPEIFSETIKSAKRYGSGVAGARVMDSIKEVEKGQKVTGDLDRSKLWAAQKPQSYKREIIQEAIEAAVKKKITLDDETEALTLINKPIHLVPINFINIRIRSVDDLGMAYTLLGAQQ